MRKFSSYGPVDTDTNYFVPRKELIEHAYNKLVGENIDKGGHYFTVWASRQCGKSWIFQQTMNKLRKNEDFYVALFSMERFKENNNLLEVLNGIIDGINREVNLKLPNIAAAKDFIEVFSKRNLDKPLILILDEFDAMVEGILNRTVSNFRDIYLHRKNENDVKFTEKTYLLHGLALIGVRSVLGVENQTGSPFNIQRSMHIPFLTSQEVTEMLKWYERESGQKVDDEVIEAIFYETNGQPGLVSWFGELLTEEYNFEKNSAISIENWNYAYTEATQVLPNNTILNLISKADKEEYKYTLFEVFRTAEKILFSFDDKKLNYLYMNGIITNEKSKDANNTLQNYVKFTCPFVQKRLFNRYSREMFQYLGVVSNSFEDLSDCFGEGEINLKNILRRYEAYLKKNKSWLLKDAPRRKDNRIYEAVYHFNLYAFLQQFLTNRASVHPEFPTGNGKIDLVIKQKEQMYGIEIKSFSDDYGFHLALIQAARYAKSLRLTEITLAVFVDYIPDDKRLQYEKPIEDHETGVLVNPVFMATNEGEN